MTTPIPDGTYYINNVQFPSSINLSGGLPYASVNGWPHTPSPNLQWIVKNVGDNQITLENFTARGYFLTVDYFFEKAPAFGSPNPTLWTVEEVTKGVYTLGAKGFLLTLNQGGTLVAIFITLPTSTPVKEQQWTFVAVS